MPGRLIRALLAALLGGSLTVLSAGAATADTKCQRTDPATGQCLLWVEVPGTPGTPQQATDDGPSDSGSGQSCYWDPSKQGLSGPPAGPVPCTSGAGYWSNSYNCYIEAAHPPPPPGDPAWQGHKPDEGAVYACYQPQTGIFVYVWSADPPPGSTTGPTPREVAQLAIRSMELSAINVGITPEPGPGSVGLVGMPVWLWAEAPDARTFGPATATASAGGITVTATANVYEVTWDMGDGHQVECRTAGTPYEASYGDRQSPDCGYRYLQSSAGQPGGTYTVTATSDWVVTWAGAGQTGTVRLDGLARSVQITVGEAQVLVR